MNTLTAPPSGRYHCKCRIVLVSKTQASKPNCWRSPTTLFLLEAPRKTHLNPSIPSPLTSDHKHIHASLHHSTSPDLPLLLSPLSITHNRPALLPPTNNLNPSYFHIPSPKRPLTLFLHNFPISSPPHSILTHPKNLTTK